MRVGISVLTRAGRHVLGSGLDQNIAFLATLLRQLTGVHDVVLIDGGGEGVLPEGFEAAITGLRLVRPQDVTHDIDVVIEMGAQLPTEWMHRVRARGAKLVLFLAGHAFADLAQGPVFGRNDGYAPNGTVFDDVWLLPQHAHSCASMMRLLLRAPVHLVPHLWAPAFVLAQGERARAAGHAFGFGARNEAAGPGPRGWRIGIFEPNTSVVKNATIPMLACEQAFREQPEAVEALMVLNSFHLKEHPSFNTLAANLDLTRAGRATYEPRVAFAECMAAHRLDAVVSHQWECGLNYLYYDALHGGYPLLHNSPFLREAGVGLFYPGFAAREGARVLLDAWRWERDRWQAYAAQADAFLRTLGPQHPANVEAFARRLGALQAVRA